MYTINSILLVLEQLKVIHQLFLFFQTVATVCVFLASKIEDTPCPLKRVVIVAYETMYRKNPDAAKRIHQQVFNFFLIFCTITPDILPVVFVIFLGFVA